MRRREFLWAAGGAAFAGQPATQPPYLFELGKRDAKHLVAVVPPRANLIGAHEIDQDMLMHQHGCPTAARVYA